MRPYSNYEIQSFKQALTDNPEALQALDILSDANGNLETAGSQLSQLEGPRIKSFGLGKDLLKNLADSVQDSICGEAGILDQIKELQKGNVTSGLMLPAVTYLSVTFDISAGLATFLLLWILRIGIDAYCRSTK